MKETGILFTPANITAILEGRKSQTRRIIKPQPTHLGGGHYAWKQVPMNATDILQSLCPYGTIGDRLYVKEACLARANGEAYLYKRDYSLVEAAGIGGMYGGWKSPMFMPKAAARLWLEITDVQAQRLINIPQLDAMEEGADGPDYKVGYKAIWESIHGPGSWERNPWVWAISFKQVVR